MKKTNQKQPQKRYNKGKRRPTQSNQVASQVRSYLNKLANQNYQAEGKEAQYFQQKSAQLGDPTPYKLMSMFKTGNQTAIMDHMLAIPDLTSDELKEVEQKLFEYIGRKYIRNNSKFYSINFAPRSVDEQRKNVVKLRYALLDSATGDPHLARHIKVVQKTSEGEPGFWSRLWGWLRDTGIPAGLGFIPEIGAPLASAWKAIANPDTGHLEEVSNTGNVLGSIRQDRSTYIDSSGKYHLNAVNSQYVNTVINPEFYFSRRPGLGFKTSVVRGSQEIPVFVNVNGNGAVMILPSNLMNNLSGSCLTNYMAIRNGAAPANVELAQPQLSLAGLLYDPTFDPSTGLQGGPTAAVASCRPAQPILSNIAAQAQNLERVVINSMSVVFKPLLSLTQTQGLVQFIQWNSMINDTFQYPTSAIMQATDYNVDIDKVISSSGLPSIPQSDLAIQPYYQSGPLLASNQMRYCLLPDTDALVAQEVLAKPLMQIAAQSPTAGGGTATFFSPYSGTINEFLGSQRGFYLLITGAQTGVAGLKVGTITLSYSAEVTTISSLFPLCPVEMALPGAATVSALKNMFQEFPQLAMMNGQELHEISLQISKCVTHDQLLATLNQFFTGKPNHGAKVLVTSPAYNAGQDQPDFYIDGVSDNSYQLD